MSLSRRSFVRTIGLGGAGLSSAFVIGRGREAMAFEGGTLQALQPPDDGVIHIDSNENARGPGQSSIEALHRAISPRVGRGYPPDYVGELSRTIAVALQRGSRPRDHRHRFRSRSSRQVCGRSAPRASRSSPRRRRTRRPKAPRAESAHRSRRSRSIAISSSISTPWPRPPRAPGWCSSATRTTRRGRRTTLRTVERFVRRVKQQSPDTAILIDEAYIDYTYDPAVKTAIPLTQELPGVFVARTYSKAHGMAGLRLGYAVGQTATVRAVSQAWSLGSMNTLTAAAGITSLRDTAHMEEERKENARVRDFTLQAFKRMGFEASDCHTNCIFVNLGRPAAEFRDACRKLGVAVGRDFPPMEKTHSRISLGTMEEMRKAVEVFQKVLGKATNL